MNGFAQRMMKGRLGYGMSPEAVFKTLSVVRTIAGLLYPSRLLFYLWLLLFGFLYTARLAQTLPMILVQPNLVKLVCAVGSISLLFVYSKIINDIHDLAIDRISNKGRPLVQGLIGTDEASGLAAILLVISGILAVAVKRDFFCLWLFIWGLSYVYSSPPFRLRRFWPVSHVVLALIGASVFMSGACIAGPEVFYTVRAGTDISMCILPAFFFLCHIKDLKDIEGDRAAGIWNLFGRVAHPGLWSLVFFGGFLASAFLTAVRAGVGMAATAAGGIICAVAAIFMVVRSRQPAELDRLFVLALFFLLYLSGAWLFYFRG